MCIYERGKFAEAIPRVGTVASVSHKPRFPGCDNLSCHMGWVGRHLETCCTPSRARWGALETVALLESNGGGKTYLEELRVQV